MPTDVPKHVQSAQKFIHCKKIMHAKEEEEEERKINCSRKHIQESTETDSPCKRWHQKENNENV